MTTTRTRRPSFLLACALLSLPGLLLGLGCENHDSAGYQPPPRNIDPLCTTACVTIVASGCDGAQVDCEDRCQRELDGYPICPDTFRTFYACCAESGTNQCVAGGWYGIEYTCGDDCDLEEGAVIACANSGTCVGAPEADAFCGTSAEYCLCDEYTISCVFDLATNTYPVPNAATSCRELGTRDSLRDYCCLKQ